MSVKKTHLQFTKSSHQANEVPLEEMKDPTLRHQITFRLLESDEHGRDATHSNHTGNTCFHILVESPHKKVYC